MKPQKVGYDFISCKIKVVDTDINTQLFHSL
jgi:hypothetical protein